MVSEGGPWANIIMATDTGTAIMGGTAATGTAMAMGDMAITICRPISGAPLPSARC